VLVLGQGIIGLYATQHFALRGAEVAVADTYPMRLDLAHQCGADLAIDVTHQDTTRIVRQRWPDGADIIADTTGIYSAIEGSLPALSRFGKYVFLGVCRGAAFDLGRLQGTRVFEAFFPWTLQGDLVAASMKLMAMDALKVDPLVSHTFSPEQAVEAYELVRTARDRYTGILFDWRQNT
jgi:threonine dehydrogenase-like Zn-dependent dehydrogenase